MNVSYSRFAFLVLTSLFLITQLGLFTNFAITSPGDNAIIRNIFFLPFLFVGFSYSVINYSNLFKLFIKYNKFLILYILFAFLSTNWAVVPSFAFERALMLLLYSLIAFFIAWEFTVLEFMTIYKIFSVIVILSTLLTALFFPGENSALMKESTRTYFAWIGLFSHKNVLGIAAAISILSFSFFDKIDNLKNYIQIILLAVSGFILYKASSSTSTAAVFVAIGLRYLLPVWRRGSGVQFLLILHTLAIISIPIYFLYIDIESFTASTGKSLTLTGRTNLWEIFYEVVKSNWLLGFGYGCFWGNPNVITDADLFPGPKVMDMFGFPNVRSGHNGYFDVFLNLGLVGIVVMLAFLGNSIKICFKRLLNRETSIKYTMPGGLLLFFLVENLAETKFDPYNSNFGFYWISILASIFVIFKLDTSSERQVH